MFNATWFRRVFKPICVVLSLPGRLVLILEVFECLMVIQEKDGKRSHWWNC